MSITFICVHFWFPSVYVI